MKNKIYGGLIIVVIVVALALAFNQRKDGKNVLPSTTPPPPSVAAEIEISSPQPNDNIVSPVKLAGRVRGNWFFEASMPVTLRDANKNIVAQMPLQAKGDWMTTDFVEFEGELSFTKPATATGFLVFENDNPSGLPEYKKSFMVPVRFQ